jgi:hypothetical protein
MAEEQAMMPLSPALFLAAASALVASDVRLPWRSAQQRLKELDPQRRDAHRLRDDVTTAAFIAHVGYWAHRSAPGKSAWPLPLDADCDALARIGLDLGVVRVGPPAPGAIYLRYSQQRERFTRASIVLWAAAVPTDRYGWTYDCQVIQGRATRRARLAWATCCPKLGDCFLSWVDLDCRNPS